MKGAVKEVERGFGDRQIGKQCPVGEELSSIEIQSLWGHLDLGWNTPETLSEKLFAVELKETVAPKVVEMNKSNIIIKQTVPAILRDDVGAIVIQVFRSFLTEEDKKVLFSSTINLLKKNRKANSDEKRGVNQVFHFGCWRKYAKLPFVTTDSRTPHAKKWIQQNRPLFRRLNQLFYNQFPSLYQR
jgi:hypothetical protein